MKKEHFLKAKEFLLKRKNLLYVSAAANKLCEVAVYLSYPIFLFLLIINKNLYCLRSVLVCGIGVVLLSLFRRYINAERPYEKYDFSPLVKKETKGNSFPSRHVFSAAVIGMSILPIYVFWGGTVLFFAVLMGIIRVALGLHFIQDSRAGLFIGIIIGLFSFILPYAKDVL